MRRPSFAAALLSILLAPSASAQGEGELEQRASTRQTIVGFNYSYAWFQGDIDAWNVGAVSVGRRGPSGSFAARMNLARRFATNGAQFEAEAYPILGKAGYAFLNVGYSRSAAFPEWRFGGELFRSLPHALEVSAGVRQLRFTGIDPVTLFTGSVGQHAGRYWFSLRPYVRERDGLSTSAIMTMRHYFADADNWVGGRVGYGPTPSDDPVFSQLSRTGSLSAALIASRSTSTRAVTTWSFSFEREELSASRYRNHWEAGAGLRLRY